MVQEDEQRRAEQRRRRVEEDRSAAPLSSQPPPLWPGRNPASTIVPVDSMLCSAAPGEHQDRCHVSRLGITRGAVRYPVCVADHAAHAA